MTTPTNKLTEVLQAIRDANPETMELSFGCRVTLNENAWRGVVIILGTGWSTDYQYLYGYEKGAGHNEMHCNRDEINKIIGHPLHIGHLLKALPPLYKLTSDSSYSKWAISGGGHFYAINLTQDLETQLKENPELVDTLYSLLVSK